MWLARRDEAEDLWPRGWTLDMLMRAPPAFPASGPVLGGRRAIIGHNPSRS